VGLMSLTEFEPRHLFNFEVSFQHELWLLIACSNCPLEAVVSSIERLFNLRAFTDRLLRNIKLNKSVLISTLKPLDHSPHGNDGGGFKAVMTR